MATGTLLETFLALRPALLRYLSLQGAAAGEGEDIVQEMGLRLSAGPTDPVDQPRAYLYRMAHNRLLLHRRTAGRRTRREEDWVDAHSGYPPALDDAPSAEMMLVAREQLAIVQAAIDRLPDRTRAIFRRFRIDSVPQARIAVELQISVSAVEKHLARAYKALGRVRKNLDEGAIAPRSLGRGEE